MTSKLTETSRVHYVYATIYEVVWGGKEFNDPNDSSVMIPRRHKFFDTEEEAKAFAREREAEDHPRLWIECWEEMKLAIHLPNRHPFQNDNSELENDHELLRLLISQQKYEEEQEEDEKNDE